MVRLSTCKSYRSLLLTLCYVKHSVGSKLFFQLHSRHQLHIGDDYKFNCSKLISMHYYLGNIVSYKALQHFGRVLFQGNVCGIKHVGKYEFGNICQLWHHLATLIGIPIAGSTTHRETCFSNCKNSVKFWRYRSEKPVVYTLHQDFSICLHTEEHQVMTPSFKRYTQEAGSRTDDHYEITNSTIWRQESTELAMCDADCSTEHNLWNAGLQSRSCLLIRRCSSASLKLDADAPRPKARLLLLDLLWISHWRVPASAVWHRQRRHQQLADSLKVWNLKWAFCVFRAQHFTKNLFCFSASL